MKLNIGENIRLLRRQADMTQEQLAEMLGVTYQSVSRWENGDNYPDLELIPRLARIFDVSADTLLDMTNSAEERFQAHVQALKDALQRQAADEVLDLLREIAVVCREYRDQDLGALIIPFANVYPHISEQPEIREQLLKIADVLLQTNPSSRGFLVKSMAAWVTDEDFETFLTTYGAPPAITAKALRIERCARLPGQWQELKALEQMNLLETLSDICCDAHMWHIPCGVSSLHTAEYLSYVTEFCLDTLHRFNLTEPDPKYPISGNGEPDMFASMRIQLGIKLAGIRTYSGDKEGAYTVLEDMVSLLEKLVGMGECLTSEQLQERWQQEQDPTLEKTIPEDPVLTCASPAMEGLTARLHQQWARVTPENGEPYYQQIAYIETDRFYASRDINAELLYYMSIPVGTGAGIYTWMNPLKEEDRYKALLERVRACTRIRPLEQEA